MRRWAIAHFSASAMDCLEVLPVGCNKGAALAVLSQHLGFTLQECMAFGDAMNDREMLGSVGRGFIMGNAMPQLSRAAASAGNWRLPESGSLPFLTHWLDNPDLPYSRIETLPASQIGFYLAFLSPFDQTGDLACRGAISPILSATHCGL